MSNVIYLTTERIAQARSRLAGRYLAAPRLSPTERARRRQHAKRMLVFAQKVRSCR
jgi:hypothetical protein